MYGTYNKCRGRSLTGYNSEKMDSKSRSKLSSALRSKPSVSLFSSSSEYKSTYPSSFSKSQRNDIVRPAMRNSSIGRHVTSDRQPSQLRDSSIMRSFIDLSTISDSKRRGRDLSIRSNGFTSKNNTTGISSRPVRAQSLLPSRTAVPEFTTIQSKSKVEKSLSLSNNFRLNDNLATPQIESKRSIAKGGRISSSYSPSFFENKTSNNNKDHENDASLSPRPAAFSGKHEQFLNGLSPGLSSWRSGESSSKAALFKDANAGLIGLMNIGNTCFMNSIIQCLSNTRLLRDYCINKAFKKEVNRNSPMKGKLMEAFGDLVHQLWNPQSSNRGSITTAPFKAQIQKFSKRFSGYEQQDCQEFLRFLIEGLHEDINQALDRQSLVMSCYDSYGEEHKAETMWEFYLSKDKSFIVDMFMGQLKSSLECQECNHVSITFDPFWDLSLPLPKDSYGRSNLQSCLQNFTRKEVLDGDERPTCEKCQARRRMTKKFTIHRFPQILVIHLKRFSEGSLRQKLTTKVGFSHQLTINSPISSTSAHFELYAVSNHIGSCYGGHYTAYCKNPELQHWHHYDDTHVSSIAESSVQSNEAYVLFYEQSLTQSIKSHL